MELSDVLFTGLLLAFGVQFWFLSGWCIAIISHRPAEEGPGNGPVSVIICARNEAERLARNLPRVLDQEYPDFEVIVVDDGSEDNTWDQLLALSRTHSRLKPVRSRDYGLPGKRNALLTGVRTSRNEFLLFTDADCYPSSHQWIARMTAPLEKGYEIVLGASPVEKKRGLKFLWQRFEVFHVIVQYLGFALSGVPYMGTGRNLACRKTTFLQVIQDKKYSPVNSGDDDLFVNLTATRFNTRIVCASEAFTFTEPYAGIRQWFTAKKRHHSTARHYKTIHIVLLSLWHASQLIFYLSAAVLCITGAYGWALFAIFVIRVVFLYCLYGPLAIKLDHRDMIKWLPWWDLLLAVFLLLAAPFIFIERNVTWQQRANSHPGPRKTSNW